MSRSNINEEDYLSAGVIREIAKRHFDVNLAFCIQTLVISHTK